MKLTKAQRALLEDIRDMGGYVHVLATREYRPYYRLSDLGLVERRPGNPPPICITEAGRAALESK